MADIGFGGGDKASDAPVELPVKRNNRRSGKRWGAEVNDPSTATPSGVQALVESEGQAAAEAPNEDHGDDKTAQKSRKPRHKRWGPDKDAPDPAGRTRDPAVMADSAAEHGDSTLQQKLKRKRWGPDAPTPEPEEEAAKPAQMQEEQPAKGKRRRWGPEGPQVNLSGAADEPGQQPEAHDEASEAGEGEAAAAGKSSKKRRWGPEEPAAEAMAAAPPAPLAPVPEEATEDRAMPPKKRRWGPDYGVKAAKPQPVPEPTPASPMIIDMEVPPQAEAASKRPPEPAARPSRRRWGADPGRAAPSAPMQNGLPSGLELPSGPATPLRPPAQQAMSRSEASSAMGDPGREKHVQGNEQPVQPVQPEDPAPMLEVLPRAPNIPSDPSFKLPEGMDPLSAVLLQKEPDQEPSEDNSASEDGKDLTKADTTAPAVSSINEATGGEVLPPPPAVLAAAAGATSASATATAPGEAALPAVPKLTPPPWAAVGQASTPGRQLPEAAVSRVQQLRQVFEGGAARRPGLGSHRPGYQRPAPARPPPENPMKEWSLVEEARAIALQAAAEQREKLMARAREAEAAKAAAEAADAAPAASAPSPALTSPASGALTTAGTPEAPPAAQYDSETAAYLAQQGTPRHGPQEGTRAAGAQSTPFHGPPAPYPMEAASMAPPGMLLTQTVQMSMPHELDTSYYGWPMPYQLPPQQPVVPTEDDERPPGTEDDPETEGSAAQPVQDPDPAAAAAAAAAAQAYGYDYSAYGYPGYYDPADPYAGYYAGAYGQQYDPNAASTVEDPDPNGIATWAAWASVASNPQDGADQWQVWQAAAAAAGYDIGPEAAAHADDEPEAPPGMSDVEDDSALPLRKEPKVVVIPLPPPALEPPKVAVKIPKAVQERKAAAAAARAARRLAAGAEGGENEEDKDRPLPGSLPAELPNGRVPRLESSKGWGRLDLPSKSKPKPQKPAAAVAQDEHRESSSPEPETARSKDRRGSGRMRSPGLEARRTQRRGHRPRSRSVKRSRSPRRRRPSPLPVPAKEPTPEPSEKESGELEEGEVGADAGDVTSPPADAAPAAAAPPKPAPKPVPETAPARRQLSSPVSEPRRSLDNIGEPLPRSAPGRVPPPPRPPPRAVPPGGPGPPPRPMQGGPFRQPPRPGFPPGPRPPARRPPAQQYDGDSYDEIYEEHMGMPQQWPQKGPMGQMVPLPAAAMGAYGIYGAAMMRPLLPMMHARGFGEAMRGRGRGPPMRGRGRGRW